MSNEAAETQADIAFAIERMEFTQPAERACFEHFIEVNRARLEAMMGKGRGVERLPKRDAFTEDIAPPGVQIGGKVPVEIKNAIVDMAVRRKISESEALRRLIQCGLEVEAELRREADG